MLLDRGESVRGVDLLTSDLYPREQKIQRLLELKAMPNFDFHELDMRTGSLRLILQGVSTVIHFSALAGLAGSWVDPGLYASHNIDATRHLLGEMVDSDDVHLVHASTSSVYGFRAVGDENVPVNPVSPYGVTKLAAETLIREFAQTHGISFTILRFFSVYGPNQRPDMAYSKICQALLSETEMIINGDGLQRRSNTFVDDAARAAIAAADHRLRGETFNIAGRESLSLLDAVNILAGEMGVNPVLRHGPDIEGDQRETKGNSDRAMRLLGWEPEVTMRDGLGAQARAAVNQRTSLRAQHGLAS